MRGDRTRICTGNGHSAVGVWSGVAPVCAGWQCTKVFLIFNYSVSGQPLFLSFQGITYTKNDRNILVTRIGTTNDAFLTCHTDSTTCCRGVDNGDPSSSMGTGEWLFPNGTSIARNRVPGDGFYWNRYYQVLRLYRQGDIQTPLGTYCCRIPDNSGEMRTFCANLIGDLQ